MHTLLAAGLLVAAASGGSHKAPAKSLFPYPIKSERLDNGLTLVVVPMKSPGLMAYYTLVRVGSRNEVEPGHSGFAHFFEHMMFRGTKTWSPEKRNALLQKIGVEDNAFTSDDFTCYTVFGPNGDFEELVSEEADRMQHLEYDEGPFQTEARAVLGEYNKNFSDPAEKMSERLSALAFTKHTYQHTTMGFEEDIQAMPTRYEYSKQFFQRFYRPDNVVVVVAGDVDPKSVSALVKKYYGPWSGKGEVAAIPVEPPQTAERTETFAWDAPTAPRIMFGYHTPAQDLGAADDPAQLVLSTLLFGTVSKLYQDLVLDQGVVESFDDLSYPHRDPNLLAVNVTLKDEKDRAKVWKAINDQIDAVAAGQVDAALLKDVVSNTRYSILMDLETPQAVAGTLIEAIGPTGRLDAIDERLARLQTLTPAQVSAFAKKWLRPENRTVVNLTSKAEGGAK